MLTYIKSSVIFNKNWIYESIGHLYYYEMKGNPSIQSSWSTSTIIDHKFKEIANEHSLTTSYGPLICKNLSYGGAAIDAKDGFG